MSKEHTQTPWKVGIIQPRFDDHGDHRTTIQTENGAMDIISPPCMEEFEDNARLIVRAVNSHEALVSALEKIANLPDGGRGYGDQAASLARAALALAKEGE